MRKTNFIILCYCFCFVLVNWLVIPTANATVCNRHAQVSELFNTSQTSFDYKLNNSDIGRVDFFIHLTSSSGTLSPSFLITLDDPTDSVPLQTKSLSVVTGGIPDPFDNGDGVQLFHLGGNSYQVSLHLTSYYDMLGMCGPIATGTNRLVNINISNLSGSGHLQVNAVSKKCQPSTNSAIPAEAVVITNPAIAFSEVAGSCPTKQTDVVFVLDRSGSMSSAAEVGSSISRETVLNQTTNTIFNIWMQQGQFNHEDHTGVSLINAYGEPYISTGGQFLVNFQTVPPNDNVAPFVFNAELNNLISDTYNFTVVGCTSCWDTKMGEALQVALTGCSVLGASCSPSGGFEDNDHYRHIVLFTDGQQQLASTGTVHIDHLNPQAPTTMQGVELRAYGVPIHTLGTGFDENTTHGIGLRRIALDTGGWNQFFTSPTTSSTNAFLSAFVNIFQANSLGLVEFRNGEITKGQSMIEEKHFQINRSAKRVEILLGWHPEDQADLNPNALTMEVIPPGTITPMTYGIDTNEDHFHIKNIILPLPGGTPHEGEWTVRIQENLNGSSQKYHLGVLVDETQLEYSVGVVPADYGTGDPIILQAVITQNGEPVKNLSSVNAVVSKPLTGLGAFLNHQELPLSDIQNNPPDTPADAFQSNFDRKLYRLLTDPRFADLTKPVTDPAPVILFDDERSESGDAISGDGIYTGKYEKTKIPGTYEFVVTAKGSTPALGQFSRSGKSTALVRVIYADPDESELTAYKTKKNEYAVSVIPADAYKNVLGPGFSSQIEISVENGQGSTLSPVVDERENGTYNAEVKGVPVGADPTIMVKMSGQEVGRCRLSECMKPRKRYAVFASAGENFPVSDFDDDYDSDLSLRLGFEYLFTNQWSVEASYGHEEFDGKRGNRDLDVDRVSANAKFYPIIGTFQLGLLGGLGVYNADPGDTDIGVNLGVAGEYRITTQWSLEVNGGFHNVFNSGDDIRYTTLQGGLRFRF